MHVVTALYINVYREGINLECIEDTVNIFPCPGVMFSGQQRLKTLK